MPDFTARNVAKYVARTIVGTKTAQLTTDAITDYTRFDDDDTIVNITAGIVGWYVSDRMRPVTDKMVDVTADRIVAFREKRQNKTEE